MDKYDRIYQGILTKEEIIQACSEDIYYLKQSISSLNNELTAEKHRADVAEKELADYITIVDGLHKQLTSKCEKCETEQKHRAEVAEEALRLMAERCSTTCIYGKNEDIADIITQVAYFTQQAEERLKGKQND